MELATVSVVVNTISFQIDLIYICVSVSVSIWTQTLVLHRIHTLRHNVETLKLPSMGKNAIGYLSCPSRSPALGQALSKV